MKFLNKVALRTAPPRNSTGTEGPKAPRARPEPKEKTVAEPVAAAEDPRTALQKLADRFR